jgi:hypothetical protein
MARNADRHAPESVTGMARNRRPACAGIRMDALTPKWSSKLAAFDVYIWDQCYAMEQSLRIDE